MQYPLKVPFALTSHILTLGRVETCAVSVQTREQVQKTQSRHWHALQRHVMTSHSFSKMKRVWSLHYRIWYILVLSRISRNFKGGIGSLFDSCVNAMGRRPYWPSREGESYCTFGFGDHSAWSVHIIVTAWFNAR